ncbi:hypothetical protein HanIR_Chr13g0634511 [Helianthus annuus]|nr:hypothetical protein HanIR_Chr13g0634511 [Helianthus annuus]
MTVVMPTAVCQRAVESQVVVAPCLRVDGFQDDWNQENRNSRVAIVWIVVYQSNIHILDSLELVFVTHLHLEFLNFHCNKSP